MLELNEFSEIENSSEYAELMSILEETKKEITKLQVNVQASVDLKNLSVGELSNKIDGMINNREKENTWDEYICCVLSDMTQKSELNWPLYWQTKKGKDFLTKDEEFLLSGIDLGRTQYLNEHVRDKNRRDKIKHLLKKLVKSYKELDQ